MPTSGTKSISGRLRHRPIIRFSIHLSPEDARRQLAAGANPTVAKRAARDARADTFKAIALEW